MTQPTRPYDALYDGTFTVAGPRDHYRQQTLGGGFNIERAPVYNNFFSELPHYPPSTLRLKNGDRLPGFIDRNFRPQPRDAGDLQQRSEAPAVSGPNRPKYFRRPLLAAAEIHVKQSQSLPPLPQYQDLNATAPAAITGHHEPRSKTIGTQSDFRENEAQTAPWDPGFVLPERPTVKQQALSARYHCDGPEVLHLRDMTFTDGLPAGLQEVIRIDKMRAKRAFEATLPPIDDAARLPLRQKMIEEWEAREWEEREQEILSIQEQRLALLENALQVREEEVDGEHEARVEHRKKATLAARAGKFADVQATRIKTMRQLIENRKYVEKHRKLHKPTIVERYANFGSGAYAPLQREGRFPESKPLGQEIETEGYEPASLKGIMDLEAFLPSRLLNPKVSAPKRVNRLDFAGRKEAAVQRDLKAINDLLDASKATAGRGQGDCWPAPLKDEPSAGGMVGLGGGGAGPSLKRTSSSMGKASAGGMGTGRLGSAGAGGPGGAAAAASISGGGYGSAPLTPMVGAAGVAPGLAASPSTRRVVRAVERPPTPELPPPPVLTSPQHAAVVLLQRLLRGRAAQNVMYEGRLRRQELIDELRLAERVSPDGARLDGAPIRRPEDRDTATLRVDALLGLAVSEVCSILAEADPLKQNILLAALTTSRAHTEAAVVAAAAADIAAAASAAAQAAAAARSAIAAAPAPAAVAPLAPSPPPAAAQVDGGGGNAINLEALGITREQAEEAATRIQAAFHGRQARKEVAAMRARGEMLRRVMENGDEHKVVLCQAAVRGYLNRKKVRQLREARVTEAAEAEAGASEAGEATDADGSAAEAETKYDLSSYTDEQVEAITRIQAAQRGYLARKRVAAIRTQQQQPEGGQQDEADSPDQDADGGKPGDEEQLRPSAQEEGAEAEPQGDSAAAPPPPPRVLHPDYTVEQEVAVIHIQAAMRGHLARRHVAAIREGHSDGYQHQQPSAIGRQDGLQEDSAAAAAGQDGMEEAQQQQQQEEEEALWPKMRDLSGFVLKPAAPAAKLEAEALSEGLAEAAAADAQAEAEGQAEAEASMGLQQGEREEGQEERPLDGEGQEGQAEPEQEASPPEPEPETEPEPEPKAEAEANPEAEPAQAADQEAEPDQEASLAGGTSAPTESRAEAEGEASLSGGTYAEYDSGAGAAGGGAEGEASLTMMAGGGSGDGGDGAVQGDESSALGVGEGQEEGGEGVGGEEGQEEGRPAEVEGGTEGGEEGGKGEEGQAGQEDAGYQEGEAEAEGQGGEGEGAGWGGEQSGYEQGTGDEGAGEEGPGEEGAGEEAAAADGEGGEGEGEGGGDPGMEDGEGGEEGEPQDE